jgi:hypothetical protein
MLDDAAEFAPYLDGLHHQARQYQSVTAGETHSGVDGRTPGVQPAWWPAPLAPSPATSPPRAAFLASSAGFLLESPWPRVFTQPDLTQPAVAAHSAVPEAHAHLFVRELHEQLRETAADSVARAIDIQLVKPLELWQQAYRAAKVGAGRRAAASCC